MNVGKTLFAQVMEFVPWKTFGRIIERHKGDAGVRTLGCADLFRVMAFSQLTWRESLRDIEVCLEANQAKLFHMGIATPPARSTLADALNLRDWRIYHALALRLISHALEPASPLLRSGSRGLNRRKRLLVRPRCTCPQRFGSSGWAIWGRGISGILVFCPGLEPTPFCRTISALE